MILYANLQDYKIITNGIVFYIADRNDEIAINKSFATASEAITYACNFYRGLV
jgi:hypothetical protein